MVQEFSALVQAGCALIVALIAIRSASRPHVSRRVVVKRERPQ